MTVRICTLSAALVLLLWQVPTGTGSQQDGDDAKAAKLRELLQQRHLELEARYQAIQRRYYDGSLSFEHVLPALTDLMQAKLELVVSEEDKQQVYQQWIDASRTIEDHVGFKVEAGLARIDQQHAATAARLRAEIDLLRLDPGNQ